jgi:hypothetical protein
MIEDYERLSEMDKMYLMEKEREIEEEWRRWMDEHDEYGQLPAKIVVNIPKEVEK